MFIIMMVKWQREAIFAADLVCLCEKGQRATAECWTWTWTWRPREYSPTPSLPAGLWASHCLTSVGLRLLYCSPRVGRPDLVFLEVFSSSSILQFCLIRCCYWTTQMDRSYAILSEIHADITLMRQKPSGPTETQPCSLLVTWARKLRYTLLF